MKQSKKISLEEIIDEVLPMLPERGLVVPSITQWLKDTIKENRKHHWRNTGGSLAEHKPNRYNGKTICSANVQPAKTNSGNQS
jgi:hypothetical protein